MKQTRTAILHYSASPVIGGVEVVVDAHAATFVEAGHVVMVIAGRGTHDALPAGTDFVLIPEVDSQHPRILAANRSLEAGAVPADFQALVDLLVDALRPLLAQMNNVIVHNAFTKHFNLPLTAALYRLLDARAIRHCIAWCHDFTWTSPHSRAKVHEGYPWDLLRTYRPDVTYVVVSESRRRDLGGLLGCPLDAIHTVYNGVDPATLLGLSPAGYELARRLGMLASDLNLLMPVRVTQAKNIEYALRVVAALKARGVRPKLVLTGPPDPHDPASMAYFRELQALRRELNVEAEMRFVFESGPNPDAAHVIDVSTVGELLRLSDVMFMPSHREGFGMPILEAGLAGIPVVATEAVPAARELGDDDVLIFNPEDPPDYIAGQILDLVDQIPVQRLRRRVRGRYTWPAICERDIKPLLK